MNCHWIVSSEKVENITVFPGDNRDRVDTYQTHQP